MIGTSDNLLSPALGMSSTIPVSLALIVVYGNVSLQDSVLREVFHLVTIQVMFLFNVEILFKSKFKQNETNKENPLSISGRKS